MTERKRRKLGDREDNMRGLQEAVDRPPLIRRLETNQVAKRRGAAGKGLLDTTHEALDGVAMLCFSSCPLFFSTCASKADCPA